VRKGVGDNYLEKIGTSAHSGGRRRTRRPRNEFPQACIDAPGVDRRGIHASIGDAALKFYDASLKVPRGK
jgi:hypothetical protein